MRRFDVKAADIAEWSDDQVMQAVTPSREKPDHRSESPEPAYADIRHELQTNKHVTLLRSRSTALAVCLTYEVRLQGPGKPSAPRR
jgi:hypothetical protein